MTAPRFRSHPILTEVKTMFGAAIQAPAAHLSGPHLLRDERIELLQLMALREIEDRGPLTGKEALDAVALLTCSLDLEPAAFALIHDLRDAGLVEASAARPPRYSITRAGRREAEHLAARCWPDVQDALARLNVCIGCLSPRDDGAGPPG